MTSTPWIAARSIVLLGPLLAIGACTADKTRNQPREPIAAAATRTPPVHDDRPAAEPAAATTVHPWEGGQSVQSNAGTYLVVYKTVPSAIPRGETFAIEAWIFLASAPDQPRSDVRLFADAAMPEHGHGMNRVPRVEKLEDRFRIDGMLFHMPGRWQLYLDVTSGALTERAQVDVDLE